MESNVDTELKHLNICDQLRANSSFMKVLATLFHYGNQSMNAAQLVIAVRALNLLPLRGETPKSTIQGIISTSRKAARDLRQPDPFQIDKDNSGRQAKYSIAEVVLNGATVPAVQEIPDEPIILKPVEHSTAYASSYSGQLGKRQRKTPKFYTPDGLRKVKSRSARAKLQRKRNAGYGGDSDSASDIDVDLDEDSFMSMGSSDDDDDRASAVIEEDTISGHSLVYAPPTTDNTDYIDPINFEDYPIAAYFAIAQQKGYSYPRFRSHEKVKIPKINCEDKFRVADIVNESTKHVVGRMFILADGHGGRGCSEYFVRHTPAAVQKLCANYDPQKFEDKQVHKSFETDIKKMVETLDSEYLDLKRIQLGRGRQRQLQLQQLQQQQLNSQKNGDDSKEAEKNSTSATTTNDNGSSSSRSSSTTAATEPINHEEMDNDGCTLIINIFFGNWLININVGDSRSVLISAPNPATQPQRTAEELNNYPLMCGLDNDYKMDVVFASQDHKPYLEHLAREILENGGEFIDSVQDRVIKVDLDKLREDGNRQAKRVALKNARIRPKGYHANHNNGNHGGNSNNRESPSEDNAASGQGGYAAQSAVRTTANHFSSKPRSREDRIPSLNVARSCGDLDFKMNPERKIISCEPDVAFFRISDDADSNDEPPSTPPRTLTTSGIHKAKRRHFLFMGTDGMFDYMYEETPERQNRAVAKVLGPMIEDGEKVGALMLDDEENSGGQTIEHNSENKENNSNTATPMAVDQPTPTTTNNDKTASTPDKPPSEQSASTPDETKGDSTAATADISNKEDQVKKEDDEPKETNMETEDTKKPDEKAGGEGTMKEDGEKEEEQQQQAPKPRLFRELDDETARQRKIRERTLVMAARYFANRESVHGFFSSTLQDYDDCTIVLIEI
ncbi:hypothetical protein BDB00DRAFT_621041 [Zychaea mexicana]|uniref:uncharacterized protein n=1 Tax=Zychaea mexicana TaxID=64656 RepID=UPI0022FDBE9F|nr:uncharacterized protein BDB00DRAFT_621041 [Zychaea mexicana]KAI9497365.1 hypothetical protein BDB00DRAFT_621041 [Zychaea mexicana]